MSIDLIAPFLPPPVQEALFDPALSEIMLCNGHFFVEQSGLLSERPIQIDHHQLRVACRHIATAVGGDLRKDPLCESRLGDGSRVAIATPPVSMDGIVLTIRKFRPNWFTLAELVEAETLSSSAAQWLTQQITLRKNILISGSTGSGKTTLLRSFADHIPAEERLLSIEEIAELPLRHRNLVRFEAHDKSIETLVRHALRQRPDRIIIGEVRGAEAFDLLEALNTGHGGSFCTIHANSARRALRRLATCVMKAKSGWEPIAIEREVAEAIQVVVHLTRRGGQRVVSEIATVERFDGTQFVLSDPFQDRGQS